jgi:beta-glucosidase-like glycosyl hydrolase
MRYMRGLAMLAMPFSGTLMAAKDTQTIYLAATVRAGNAELPRGICEVSWSAPSGSRVKLPSSLGATSSWGVDSACEFGAVIGQELRAQGFNLTLGGRVDLARNLGTAATSSTRAKILCLPVQPSVPL